MTNATVERSDSQRSQGNGTGPRVSFNRDVHVKRIGPRQPNADFSHHNYPPSIQQTVHSAPYSYTPPLRREPATDLTENQIRKEAALVLARASQVDCHAESNCRPNGHIRSKVERKKDLPPDRFNSLPNRKKNGPVKPLGRSSSDASTKSKSKRPSIFSLFSKKSTSDPVHPSHTQDTQWKRVTRSRSDVGSTPRPEPTTTAGIRKRNNSETDETLVTKRKSVPLSPIIESPSRQSYFDSATDDVPSGNIGFTSQPDLDMVPSKPISFRGENGSPETDMHSSQQPAERLPLTKGVTVDGIVKHLSKERFSPVPNLQTPAFSYTRPNHNYNNNFSDDKKIVYAHLMPDPIRETSLKPSRSQSPAHGQLRSSLSPPKRWQTDSNVEESPIVPVIRKTLFNADPQIDTLSNRRKLLESRITSRKIGSVEQLPYSQPHSGYRHDSPDNNPLRSKSMGRDTSPVVNRKPTEETIYSPPYNAYRSKSFEREQHHADSFDETDGPVDQDYVTHQHSRFANNSHNQTHHQPAVIDLGFIDDLGSTDPDDHYFQHQKYQERYRNEFEPNSLESQFNDTVVSPKGNQMRTHHRELQYPEQVHTLRREKKAQHSLERGDSGIERDYRKSSGDEFTSTLRRRSSSAALDPKTLTEQFLKRERLHSERIQANRYNLMFRERSIDDGSLFDPRLDKYPVSTMTRTLRRNQSTSPNRQVDYNGNHTINRSENKLGRGIEKVKLLFTGKKKTAPSPASSVSEIRKEKTIKVPVEEIYGNEPTNAARETKSYTDIAMRRRLSTPKASPLPKRTSPNNQLGPSIITKSHNQSSPVRSKFLRRTKSPEEPIGPQKKGWYKSLERLTSPSSAKSKSSSINSHGVNHSHVINHKDQRSMGYRQLAEPSPPASKLRFFGDTDLESNPPTFSKATTTLNRKRIPLSSVNAINTSNTLNHHQSQTLPRKHGSTLRGPSIERNSHPPQLPPKSSKKDFKSSAKHLHDISESASDADDLGVRSYSIQTGSRSPSAQRQLTGSTGSLHRRHDDRPKQYRSQSSEIDRRREPHSQSPGGTAYRKPPSGSQHYKTGSNSASQSIDRRKTVSRERERIVDSSGTEGDSSQNSQRSVVYLHATTVGAIPQPHVLHSRRAKSREELSSLKSSSILSPASQSSKVKPQLQPMTRTVSRSLSVLAPWAPKHIHDGYEINYSQQNHKKEHQQKTLPKPSSRTKDYHRSSTTLGRPSNNNNYNTSSYLSEALPGQFREHDLRRETLSVPRR